MKRFFVLTVVLVVFSMLVSCGGSSNKENTPVKDGDAVSDEDADTDDSGDTVDDDSDTSHTEEPDEKEDSDNPQEPEDTDIPETPDETPDSDTPENPEATENHKISGILQAGTNVSGIEAALYECGKTEEIASADTDAKGKFSFKADISAAKTYCVKAGDFASCFIGMSDHTANISEITTAAYLLDKTCADIRKSETKIRKYAKLGTGEWLGELDYSKLSGIAEGLKLLASFIGSNDAKTLSEKIAEDAGKETPEFAKLFNGFKVVSDKNEIVIGETADANANFSIEGGSTKVASGFKITWTLKNKSAEAATYKFTTSNPGEYVVRAKLTAGNETLSQDSATVLFLQRKNGGTVYVSDTSKNISFRIDDGIYGVIPKGTVVKKNGNKINSISYEVLSAGGNQVSRLKFRPEGTTFEGDSMYFVHELGTVYGGDPQVLSAKRTNANGTVDVLNSAAGDPIMMAAAGDPIMTTAAGDPIMTAAAGDPIMTSAAGDPIMNSAAGDPIMSASAGDPIMSSAAGDPIMTAAAGDPIMMGTSSSTMISQTGHYSTFTVEAASLPVSVEALVARWCDGSFYRGYSPVKFIKEGFEKYKPESSLLPYLTCEKFGDLGNDLYELMNKQIGYQRNLNLFENLFFVSEFYNRMNAKRESGAVAAVKNGLELRSAIAALYTATTSYNRSSNLADMFDSSMIPLTYSGTTPEDYTSKAKSAVTGNSDATDKYTATKKEMMIFANYITTSSKGPDFNSVSAVLNPDQLVCAWFNPDTPAQNCNKVYTINDAGHVTLGGTEVSVAEANAIFTKYFMPMNSRLSDSEKLDLFRTFYLALKYAGTIFYNGSDIEELNNSLLKTAYLVFDGIEGNANAVSIVDSFDASAHTVQVLDGTGMATRPYIKKLSTLTDQISLKVAAESADVEKVLINIEGKEFEKVQENTRTYYKQTGDLKEKSIVLTPGSLSGTTTLKTLLGSENVDTLGNITGRMTIVANSKISGKTYSTQKTYDFFVNDDGDGVNSKEVPADLQIFVNDSTGHAIPDSANPAIILNPGNKVYYPVNGVVSIENLTPAAYTVDAFADGYYAKSTSVNVPAGAAFSVEIRLDEELTSTADASLELSVNIATAKHPSKVYIQIYNDDMDLVANETAKFNDASNTYNKVNVEINSGRYTLLAVGEEIYNYLEAITLYEGTNTKEIKVVAKNACGNGIVDSAEECEPALAAPVSCGTIYPASTYPEKTATCNPDTCTFDKQECGKAAYCGDGIIDAPSEGCDGGAKDCSEIAGFGNSKGTAPCASDCSGYITANNCTKTTASCGSLPANAQWNDGEGTFAQTYDGTNWIPASQNAQYGTTKDECTFSCAKGYRWNGSQCLENPLSLGLICTGADSCFDNTNEGECPAYGESFFGQDVQYAEAGFCTPHTFTTSGSGNKMIVIDAYTHYEWTAAASENAMNWDAADDYCSHIDNESGSSAVWRLPSPAELLTIMDADNASPALDNNYFTAYGHTFWAKEDAKVSGNAWRIDENGALVSVSKGEANSVLCVRVHDYDAPESRFTATDETVKDSVSGLMWQKQPVASRTWAEALNYCEEVATSDKFDWRLPNRNELASLVDYTKANGATSDFPAIAAKGFWTSTSDISSAANAWTVDFATGSISSTEKTSTKYIICVRNDEPCFGDECADPCGFAPCKNMANSTGLCTAGDYDFTCGCKSGFNWNHAKCLLDTTRYVACEGLPENAVWNTVFGISQTYDGDKWYPSEVGQYNKTPSSTECRFVCATNYKWDAEEERCIPNSRLVNCSQKPLNSEWNAVSNISQTWSGDAWLPSSTSVYNEELSEYECRFKCKEHYNWDSEDNICISSTQTAVCIGLPENASWWNEPSITQTWTNEGWMPSTVGSYNDTPVNNECRFKCNSCYTWDNGRCVAKTRSELCKVLPENAEWNSVATVLQECNGDDFSPSDIGVYSEEPSLTECRFKCKENFSWDAENEICVANTRVAECNQRPENSLWNEVHFITQTWNGTEWLPKLDPQYSVAASKTECKYKCDTGYYPLDGKCVENPCDDNGYNPCSDVNNSTGVCTIKNNPFLPYSCECESGYNWNGKTGCREKTVAFGNICTGTVKCFDNGDEIACPSAGNAFYGQDAQYADMGYCTPKNFVFDDTVPSQITVIDKNTGLEWQKNGTARNWNDAVAYCEGLDYGGHSDWRLPSITELATTVDRRSKEPDFDYDYFDEIIYNGSAYNFYWSSSSNVSDSESIWISFGSFVLSGVRDKTSTVGVRCVRGNTLPESSFETIGNGIVKDSLTKLYWQKSYAQNKTWQEALEYCENLEYGGYTDWRLPNTNELQTLLNYGKSNPASDFPDMPAEIIFHTSSPAYSCQSSVVYSATGEIRNSDKGDRYRYSVRCVRSDQCDEGDFWDGKNCIATPCGENSCTMEHSDGTCTPLTATEFSCGCDEGFIWDGTACAVNPCSENKCASMEGSDGICTPADGAKFTCGCTSGYFWNGSRCMKKRAYGNICTGQNKCSDETGEISCPDEGSDFFGQDAYYAEKGFCVPQSFTEFAPDITHPDEIVVKDNNSGIMWQKNIPNGTFDWDHAVAHCSDLEYAGYNDWRLPTPEELLSVFDLGNIYPQIFTYPMPYNPSSMFRVWTSASKPSSTDNEVFAYFYFTDESMIFNDGGKNYNPSNAVCVRGEILPKSEFVVSSVNGEEIVTDTVNGLVWQKGYVVYKSWKDALEYCETLDYAGFTDWRLPNRSELFTLVDFSKTGNKLSSFPGEMPDSRDFWTSSTMPGNDTQAYVQEFARWGTGSAEDKTSSTYTNAVRCVR